MSFIEKFSEMRVLVVGDIMLDRYWWGNVSRISPEAPVPVVNLEKVSATLGGAANVAANVAGLGAAPFLLGVVGRDEESELFFDALKEKAISADFIVRSNARRTTVKTRIVAHHQQMMRIDQETKMALTPQEEAEIWRIAENLIEQVDIIIISDYAKGLTTENLLSRLITTCENYGKIILVDPKGKNFSKYKGASMLTPNQSELAEFFNGENYDENLIDEKGSRLLKEAALKYLLVTQGEGGMTLFEKNEKPIHLPVELRNVYDVTGAGDTVIACLAVAIAAGASLLEAAKFANRAAGLVIEKVGTTAITLEMLSHSKHDR